jgi:extracellular elastinolytic metalloproteinase
MMQSSFSRASRVRSLVLTAAIAALAFSALPAAGAPDVEVSDEPFDFQGEQHRIHDADSRAGAVAPGADQQAIVASLGADVRWNNFGTPHTLINYDGYLATGYDGDAADAARSFLRDHAALYRMTPAAVDDLELVLDSPLLDSPDQGAENPEHADVAHVVLFRQRFDGLPAAQDGLVNVGIDPQGRVAWSSSTITGDTAVNTTSPELAPATAYRIAAGDVGRDVAAAAITEVEGEDGWTVFDVDGFDAPQRARLRALPTPEDGVRLVWETVVLQAHPSADATPTAFIHFVDATDGTVWFRTNRLDHFAADGIQLAQADDEHDTGDDNLPFPPQWTTFPAYPTIVPAPTEGDLVEEGASTDDRERWCWTPIVDDDGNDVCDRIVGTDSFEFFNHASRGPWDVDQADTGLPTFTTDGNNADTAPSALSFLTPDAHKPVRPYAPDRDYDFEWTNQWYEESCDPTVFASPQRNDIDAATTALFVGHNRIHDWGYYLGWTERNSNMQVTNFGETEPDLGYPAGRARDPETGQSQAGYVTGSLNPAYGRDNANQITLQDGLPGITNQYLWQPIGNAIYVPCVDGAYDMSVIAHEVGHAIQHRMTAGPDTGLAGREARSMGESWSDLTAVEYLIGHGFVPIGDENPFAVGAYVTGDPETGIRNYAMNDSPLNYSNLGYDFVGPQVHADGEIWSAVNYDIREALIAKYDDAFPADDEELQNACAEGELAASDCPGNRRWIQLMHDAFLLQPSAVTMPEARDAVIAADKLRFDGAHETELWEAFAARGLGEEAFSEDGDDDTEPTPDFASPAHDNATITFEPVAADGGAEPENVQIFVGEFEARTRPVADTDPASEWSDTAEFVAGTYDFLARADGFGAFRFQQTFEEGEVATVEVPLSRNLASRHGGAEVVDWDGVNSHKLIDDTESTNWFSEESEGTESEEDDVEGRQVTVALAGDDEPGAREVARVQVSAQLRPPIPDDPGDDPGENTADEGDIDTQNRFSALRAFEILTCNAEEGADCEAGEGFEVAYTSPDDAFPSQALRPRASELTLRSFDFDEPVEATHVRLRVVTNQCTGVEEYQGDLDNDPTNDTDCRTEAGAGGLIPPQGETVRAAELQVFDGPAPEVGEPIRPTDPDPTDPDPTDPDPTDPDPTDPDRDRSDFDPDAACLDDPPAAPAVDRNEIPGVHLANVDCAYHEGVAQGRTENGQNFYRPAWPTRRDQMASFVARTMEAAGYDLPPPTDQGFNDIDGNVHADRINQLAAVGVVQGTTPDTYNPQADIRRDQMAAFVARAAREVTGEAVAPGDDAPRFADSGESVHRDDIEGAAAANLVQGRTPDTFDIAAPTRRDQMASFLMRLLAYSR